MRRLELFVASALLALSPLLQAETQVQVVGLFPNAAVLLVDGQRKLVKAGQTGPGGVRVLSADSKGALLEVDGVQRSYGLSREYNQAGSAAPQKTQVSISRGVGNHYWIAGSIDGHPVQFMVDTGATSVAMNEGQARRLIDFLGLAWNDKCVDFHKSDRPVKTASVAQVRKPIYKTSVERWRKYGAGLQPLVDSIAGTTGKAAEPKKSRAKAKENA